MSEQSKLQESRKKSIPDLVAKYQKLVDEIFAAVTAPLPGFKDITKEGEEGDAVIITAEQQMFAFINVRDRALDNANKMMEKINMLEMELYAPEWFQTISKMEAEPEEKETVVKNPTKRYAQRAN
jgi:tRNA(Glu) U13 pseudouridine synthase TruD